MEKKQEENKKEQNKLLVAGIAIATILIIVAVVFVLKPGNKDSQNSQDASGNAQVQTNEKGEPISTKAAETRIELQTTLDEKGEVITDKEGNPVKVEVVVGGEENVWEEISVYEETKSEIYIKDENGEYVTDKKGEKVTESYEGEADGWSPLVPAEDIE